MVSTFLIYQRTYEQAGMRISNASVRCCRIWKFDRTEHQKNSDTICLVFLEQFFYGCFKRS